MAPFSVGQFRSLRPFDLQRQDDYLRWRDWKYSVFPLQRQEIQIGIRDPLSPSPAEVRAITDACWRTNLAIYRFAAPGLDAESAKASVKSLSAALGLRHLDANLCADPDGIATLQVVDGGRAGEYIPYSNRPIRWHTDGYYNSPSQRIRAMLLHCVQPAAAGGANRLLDPEMLYIALRDEDPAYIDALMAEDAMLIPANIENGKEIRPARSGPVFSIDPQRGHLHMRYTARTRSIEWKDDEVTRRAVARIATLLNERSDYEFYHRLQPGEGVVCNNVLHTRDAFTDTPQAGRGRKYLRARYRDRITAG